MKHASPFALLFTTLLTACGSTGGGRASDAMGSSPGGATGATDAGGRPAGSSCRASGYSGDELCIDPPAPGEGIQIHVGPTSYDDPDAVAPYLIQPGEENVLCYRGKIPESDFYYLKQQNRMRSGSHHMLISLEDTTDLVEGPYAKCGAPSAVGNIGGSQTPSRDFPGALGPEDAGIASYLPKSTMAVFQLHYVNVSQTTFMREAWVNLYKTDPAKVTSRLQGIFLLGDLGVNVPAHARQTTTLQFTPALTEKVRLFGVGPHSHAHTDSFTVWRIRGGVEEQIYKSFNWAEPESVTFNSVLNNPLPDAAKRTDGGISGIQFLEPGDTLKWACDVNNTTDKPLRFANEAYTAEMCLLTGGYISDTGGLLRTTCINGACSGGMPTP